MFIHEMRETWMPIIIFLLWVWQSCSPLWDTRYWCFGFARKTFVYTIFPIINVHMQNETNLDTQNNIHSFRCGHYNHVLPIRIHDTDALGLQEKLFFPPFFLIIIVHLWNETNLDTHYNLHSFRNGHYNHDLLIGIHDIVTLDFKQKLFFPPFSI